MRPTGSSDQSGRAGAAPHELPTLLQFLDVHAPALLPGEVRQALTATEGLFLTVVLRTQGRRSLLLREALLCLVGQDCDDFEVVVAVHDPGPAELEQVGADLRLAQALLPQRLRLVEARGGTRARPVAVGLAHATARAATAPTQISVVLNCGGVDAEA